ncbi:glycosyltransferase sugar-binding containing DXD motif domain-containing protein [Hirsutella rhossiliensis]|uniref:Glycosyltransferase sugar-binding containing DXD motif domain-containing protein n=1 Tax=Hirsutella rhossiliensis TaxID=111463 RepID=A0A9P8SLS7_9HYPO|nr:glycosyltransferase sugar-binding containing DXD motif domain-containing protein [Hirsutella rhossiliensis]KAH0967261.1 glycosyltransferase sugar-binding containing DXD motif domain-containing protein [Hirsutella rhossiliensis]
MKRYSRILPCALLFAIFFIWGYFLLPHDLSSARQSLAQQPLWRPRFSSPKTSTQQGSDTLIPQKIWQIFFRQPTPRDLSDTASWLALNRGYEYRLLGAAEGEALISRYFGTDGDEVQVYNQLQSSGMKSDLLRYLVLAAEGGVYTDIDTEALHPIDSWIPPQFRSKTRVIVGIEFDRLDGPNWETTGPIAWTDVVFEQFRSFEPDFVSLRNLSDLQEPRLIGDILVLPIDGFGTGQLHSNSTHGDTVSKSALLRHRFGGSWRKPSQDDTGREPIQDDTN